MIAVLVLASVAVFITGFVMMGLGRIDGFRVMGVGALMFVGTIVIDALT